MRIRLRLDANDIEALRPPRRTKPKPSHLTLLDAFSDPRLFAKFFSDPESWLAWTALIAAAFGLPMTGERLAIYHGAGIALILVGVALSSSAGTANRVNS